MSIKIAHGEANTDLTYPLMAERYQTDAIAVGIRQTLGFSSASPGDD